MRGIVRKETGVKKPKVGHAGTLDPLATGLLIILLGSYCKRAQEFTKLDKVYETEVTLGKTSTTDDEEGEKTEVSAKKPTQIEVNDALHGFTGEIGQIPPQFSAVKVGGKRAYKQARAGKEVKLEPRKVTIYSIDNIKYDYPKLSFITTVSSGTYIRSLARDIGQKLGTGAYMSDLRRMRVGEYSAEDSTPITQLEKVSL